jgi:type IV pilus assembly protein PilO
MRARFIILAAGLAAVVLVFFAFPFRSNRSEINDVREQQTQTRQDIDALRARLVRLQELQKKEPELRAELTRFRDALPSDPRLPDFILQVQDAANLAGIDFLSLSPSLPQAFEAAGATTAGQPAQGAAGQLQAITVSVGTTGRFFEIEDFIIRLEELRRAVRINSFTLTPGGGTTGQAPRGGSPLLSVTFQMQMFVLSPAPAPAATAPTAPGASPAPNASPAPSPRAV